MFVRRRDETAAGNLNLRGAAMKSMRAMEFLQKQPRILLFTLGFIQVALVAVLDYLTPPDLAFSIFYLFPILLAVFSLGERGGVLISIISAAAWFAADLMDPNVSARWGIRLWNAIVGLNFFLIVTYLVSTLRRTQAKERELVEFVVHDLRAPLTNVVLGLKTLDSLAKQNLPPEQKKLIQVAVTSGNWMATLINSLLELSRMEGGNMKMELGSVSAMELAEQSLRQVNLWAEEKNIALAQEIEPGLSPAAADGQITIRVLVNLLSNAIKFTPEGKTVTLHIARRDNRALLFRVTDQGPGVAKQWVKRVFDKYAQVEAGKANALPGSGLGLTFCRMSVEAQGGRIWLESEQGAGTSVMFTLPVAGD